MSAGLSTHGYVVTVVAIVVPIIFILVLTIVMRVAFFITNKGMINTMFYDTTVQPIQMKKDKKLEQKFITVY